MNHSSGQKLRRFGARFIAYLWASPNTLLGALAALVLLCLGGRARVVSGVVEVGGGWGGRAIASFPRKLSFNAMTLGHVVIGVSESALIASREHEWVHVRQYERWGPFFLPAYALSSLWQVLHGRRAYWDNAFEREAYAQDLQRQAGRSTSTEAK
ncbi:MAG: signal peptide prediction [Candidatus Hydrogenedentes bacterium]|nr:signal peptide prediction [Candidatus Hydrogenedentota bacterium]